MKKFYLKNVNSRTWYISVTGRDSVLTPEVPATTTSNTTPQPITTADQLKTVPQHKPTPSSAKSSKGKPNEKKKPPKTKNTEDKDLNASKKQGDCHPDSKETSVVAPIPVEVVTEDKAKDGLNPQECVNTDPDKRNKLLNPGPMHFSSGNHFVEVTKGLLHLYKEKYVLLLKVNSSFPMLLCKRFFLHEFTAPEIWSNIFVHVYIFYILSLWIE